MKHRFTLLTVTSALPLLWAGCAPSKSYHAEGDSPPRSYRGTAASSGTAPVAEETGSPLPCEAVKGMAVNFGEPMKLSDKHTVCSKKILADPDKYNGKLVRLVGKVAAVCPKRGCWLRLGDGIGEETVFVKFSCPVKGRLIPMEAVGKMAVVEGTVELTEISEAEARHYMQDAGAPAGEIAKIVGPQKTVRMSAPSARVMGL